MSRRIALGALVVALAAAFVVLAGRGSAARAAEPAAGDTIRMAGQASIDQSQRPALLRLSADGAGWHLDAALQPTGSGRDRRERGGGQTIALLGLFTLRGPDGQEVTGQAAGQVDRTGAGSLQLADDAGATQLDAAFTLGDDGQLALDLSGQLPTPATPEPAAPTAQSVASDQAAQGGDHTFWYLSRAAGMTAYLVLFVNMVLGLAVRTKFLDDVLARWRSFDLHQFTAILALAFLALHVFALLGDQFVGFDVRQLFVPFASTYRPFWVALGIVGLYTLVVVTVTFYVRGLIGQRAWRATHYLSFGAYVLALAHGIFSGTDSGQLWARALYWSTGLVVALLTAWRFLDSGSHSSALDQGSAKRLARVPTERSRGR